MKTIINIKDFIVGNAWVTSVSQKHMTGDFLYDQDEIIDKGPKGQATRWCVVFYKQDCQQCLDVWVVP